ncbi:hypothetical protein ACS0TY_033824 [Phlomoides rotata]
MRGGKLNLSVELKTMILQFLLENNQEGTLLKGKMIEVIAEFGVSRRSVSNIWTAAKKKKTKVRGAHKDRYALDTEMLKAIPFQKRSTYRRIAKELRVAKSLAHI